MFCFPCPNILKFPHIFLRQCTSQVHILLFPSLLWKMTILVVLPALTWPAKTNCLLYYIAFSLMLAGCRNICVIWIYSSFILKKGIFFNDSLRITHCLCNNFKVAFFLFFLNSLMTIIKFWKYARIFTRWYMYTVLKIK